MTAAATRARRLAIVEGAKRCALCRLARTLACERAANPPTIALAGRPALRSAWYEIDGARVHARLGGEADADAPALLLIHGVIVSQRNLLPLAAELAPRRGLVVPDLPGFGLSARLRDAPTLAALADAALDCARAAGHERVALVANSFGGRVAVEAALRQPQRVDRLALLAPTVDPAARSLPAQVLRWLRSAPREHPSIFAIIGRDLIDLGARATVHALRVMLDDAIEDKLPRVGCPALVVSGGGDRIVPPPWTRRVVALAPQGRVSVLPGLGHMGHYSAAPAVARVLRPFLEAR